MTTLLAEPTQLAIDGGTPIRTRRLAPWPCFTEEEIEAVASVLRSGHVNYWTGEEGRRFEQEFAEFTGCRHAIAVSSGSVALELALLALGIGVVDEVIVPARTYIACASSVARCGARPIFAGIDRDTQTITAETVRPLISPRTRAILAVHLAGHACDMDSLLLFARKDRIHVIEDGSQAHGATYKGRPVGCMGSIGVFSFCQDKIMTTGGEGGMVTMNDDALWQRAWSLKENGKSYEAAHALQPTPGFRWVHESIGTNWRMTEMQAALGRVLLRKLPANVARRRQNASVLADSFSIMPGLRLSDPAPHIGHSWYRFYAFVRPDALRSGWGRDRILQAIVAEGIPCESGICGEVYLERAFPESWRPTSRLPNARELAETSLAFRVHPTLTEDDLRDTCRAVEKVMNAATL